MKLKNKKTGEIVLLEGELIYDDKVRLLTHYNSLAELNAEWENVPEEHKSNIGDLPAFPPASLTKSKAEELLAEIEKAKNPLATYLKNKGGSEE